MLYNFIVARFRNRASAGRELLQKLIKFKNDPNAVVVGLLRGGIVTASEVAMGLSLPLGFLVIKKIGAPNDPELAIGAVTDSGEVFIDEKMISEMKIDKSYVESETAKKREEARMRTEKYQMYVKNPSPSDKTVILVDDGIATGATMIAAVRSMSKYRARKVVVAIPMGPSEHLEKVRREVDEIVSLGEDLNLSSVGEYYDEFSEVTDEEAIKILSNFNYKWARK